MIFRKDMMEKGWVVRIVQFFAGPYFRLAAQDALKRAVLKMPIGAPIFFGKIKKLFELSSGRTTHTTS
jgi:hypothetical protein